MPENIYKTTGKSLSGLPIWLERACIKLSFKAADRVLTGESFGDFVQWLSTDPSAKGKLVVVGALVDALPSIGFFDELRKIGNRTSRCAPSEHEACLVYVGRLHPEKMPSTLIDVMARVKRYTKRKRVVLRIIGDGPELDALEELAARLGVARDIDFVGSVPNEALPSHLLRATIFVSPLTGTALREAALCGLPIVAYDMDWIRGLLEHEKTALLVPPGDVEQMAREVGRLLDDAELWERLSRGATDLAWRLWSPQGVRAALHNAFDEN